ncbi:MAG: RNA ligase family protein [Flavobacteriales bacterium]|nr:RNA ligase family protein [Flavobacteriales bacterium]
MDKYQKINTIFKRDECGKIILGEYSLPEFEYLSNLKWVATEKIDGTNISIQLLKINDTEWNMEFHGKTERAEIPKGIINRLSEITKDIDWNYIFPKSQVGDCISIFGEGYGTKIQAVGSDYIKDGNDFIIFDVLYNHKYWIDYTNIKDIANKLNVGVVPFVGEFTLHKAVDYVKEKHTSSISENKNLIAEGLVLQPEIPLYTKKGERVIIKIKYRDF